MRQIMGYFKKVRKFISITVTPLYLNNMMKQKQCFKNIISWFFRVEKYRPQTLDDLISHQDILSTSKQWSMNYKLYSFIIIIIIIINKLRFAL